MRKGTGLENWDLKCRSGHVKLMNCALYVAVHLLCLYNRLRLFFFLSFRYYGYGYDYDYVVISSAFISRVIRLQP